MISRAGGSADIRVVRMMSVRYEMTAYMLKLISDTNPACDMVPDMDSNDKISSDIVPDKGMAIRKHIVQNTNASMNSLLYMTELSAPMSLCVANSFALLVVRAMERLQ